MRRCIGSICSFGVLVGVAALAGRAAGGIDPTPIPVHPIDGNLVENPHFDDGVGLSGWTASPTNPPDSIQLCSSCDFEDQLGSNGVILLVNEGRGDFSTCVPIRGGADYSIGVWTILPQVTVHGFAGYSIRYMSDRACTTLLEEVVGTFGVDSMYTPLSWQWHKNSELWPAPVGARAVELTLLVREFDGDGSFKAAFDEPLVIPEPGANAAALGAAAALLASRWRRAQASRAAG